MHDGHDSVRGPAPPVATASSAPGATRRPAEVFDPAQESLNQALRSGFNVLRILMVVLLVAYFLSGWFKVGPGEQGLIVSLGKLRINTSGASEFAGTPVFGPGSYASLPDPFEQRIPISGSTQALSIRTFMYGRGKEDEAKPVAENVPPRDKLDPRVDGTMFSGDRGLAHGLWTIEYRVANAERFVRRVGEQPSAAEPLLRALAEDAIVQTASGIPVERLTRTRVDPAEADFTLEVRRRLSEALDRLETGLVVDKVVAETVEPGKVREAFIGVTRAQNVREREINEARQTREQVLNGAAGPQYAALLEAIESYGLARDDAERQDRHARIDELLQQAGGEVSVMLERARTRATEIRETARQELEYFRNVLPAYRKQPELTAARLWTEMRAAVLGNKQLEVFLMPSVAQDIEIIINRNIQRLLEADVERYKQRYQPPKSP